MSDRTWKCPDCGQTQQINYDWLAEHGGPVCGDCDCDMELQPEAAVNEHPAVVGKLVDKADAGGLNSEDLDALVHELTASIAADVNNGGLEDQIACLVEAMGAEHTEHEIDKLIEERKRTKETDCGE